MRTRCVLALAAGLGCVAVLAAEASAMYHPSVGRFMQRDPGPGGIMATPRIGTVGPAVGDAFIPQGPYADGMNLYLYGTGDPVNSVDPLGLFVGRDSGHCDNPDGDTRRLGGAVQAFFEPMIRFFGQTGKKDITWTGQCKLRCEFVDASQRGCLFCKKRCKYKCDADCEVSGNWKGRKIKITWTVRGLDECTIAIVPCKATWEPHACEEGIRKRDYWTAEALQKMTNLLAKIPHLQQIPWLPQLLEDLSRDIPQP